VLRGISGGAHPLEPIFNFFNRKKSRLLVLNSNYVDKIQIECRHIKIKVFGCFFGTLLAYPYFRFAQTRAEHDIEDEPK
jgi:hypothetical protein